MCEKITTTVHDDAPATRHRIAVRAAHDPLFLQRVLQKFSAPEIRVLEAHYAVCASSNEARLELIVSSTLARARLAVARILNFPHTREAQIQATP